MKKLLKHILIGLLLGFFFLPVNAYPSGMGIIGNVATDPIWDAPGDIAVGAGANAATKFTMGAPNTLLGVKPDGSDLEYKGSMEGINLTGGTAGKAALWVADNTMCTADKVPLACCTGSGTGTCVVLKSATNLTDVTPLTKANFVQTKCVVIKDPTGTSNYSVEWFPYAITITEARYVVFGGNWTGQFQEGDANGLNGVDTQSADSEVTPGTVVVVTSFSNASIDANDWVLIKSTSIFNVPTSLSACFSYTIN